MENGRTEQIIDKLVDMIENGQSVPLSTGKVLVNRDEAILMLRELENIVNGELKIYREVNDRKGKIINEAKQEAENIIYEAEKTASRIRVTKRIPAMSTPFRMEELARDEQAALRTANDIYAASVIYTDEMLTEVNDVIAQAYDLIHAQYARMVESLEEKARLVAENKAELMNSLKELSKEDRYAQILELGQLLSNELYNERQKVREASSAADVFDTVDPAYTTDTPNTVCAADTNETVPADETAYTDQAVYTDEADDSVASVPADEATDIMADTHTGSASDIMADIHTGSASDIMADIHTGSASDITADAPEDETADIMTATRAGKSDDMVKGPDTVKRPDIIKDPDITEITDTPKTTDHKSRISTETLATIPMDIFNLK